MWTINNRTFKEINKITHSMICIEDVKAIWVNKIEDSFYVLFDIGCNDEFESEKFASKEEAIKFSNDIMGWENDK